MESKTVIIASYHNWQTKRKGGIHVIAELLANIGFNVLFWSVSRPLIRAFFSRDERLKYKNVKNLIPKNKIIFSKSKVENIAFFSFELIGERKIPLVKYYNELARRLVWRSFINYINERNIYPDLIIIESSEAVYYYKYFKEAFKDVKILYRVSDPILGWERVSSSMINAEKELIKISDMILACNKETIDNYILNNLLNNKKYKILENCVDFEFIKKERLKPKILMDIKNKNIFTYIGAKEPDWRLIIYLAYFFTDDIFLIICPIEPPFYVKRRILRMKNIIYIPGIYYEEVPSFVQHSDAIIVPYPIGIKKMPLDLHQKLILPMILEKPIIAINISDKFETYKLYIAKDYNDFLIKLNEVRNIKRVKYDVDLSNFKRERFEAEFKNIIRDLNII